MQPFVALEMAHNKTRRMATKYLKFLLGLDPADKIGAVDLFTEAGLIHSREDPSTPGGMT